MVRAGISGEILIMRILPILSVLNSRIIDWLLW
jgi:hypothetical protein